MPAGSARILAIDDQPYFRRFLQGLLGEAGYQVVAGATADLGSRLAGTHFDLVLVDPGEGHDPARVLAPLAARQGRLPWIGFADAGDVERAVALMRAGASECLCKPVDGERLLEAIENVLAAAPASAHPQAPAAAGAAPGTGARHDALTDENLRLLGEIARLGRLQPLLAHTELAQLGPALLELLAVEVAATQAVLWLRPDSGGAPEPVASWGIPVDPRAGGVPALSSELEAGRSQPEAGDGVHPQARLLVPLHAGGQLVGLARIVRASELAFSEQDQHAAQELAALIAPLLGQALRVRALEGASLIDPRLQLPTRAFYERVLEVEIHKAQRFGRRLCCICAELRDAQGGLHTGEALSWIVHALSRTLRNTDVLCADRGGRFWVLVTDTDPLGGVVLKRRLADRVREALAARGSRLAVVLGVSSYPLDGESSEPLLLAAQRRAGFEQSSVIHEIGFQEDAPLAAIGERLLRLAHAIPESALGEIAEFLISELVARPNDGGLLFLAPGSDPAPVVGPLMALGDAETAMEVFLATDGDTVPACPALTAVALPRSFDPDTTWIVRFGEGPPYALVAGVPSGDGTRPVFHSTDPVLVEQMTFRLCAELGVGVRA